MNETLTAQGVFETVCRHLFNQGQQSIIPHIDDFDECRYRTSDGRKCAVGCLLLDEEYKEEMENQSVMGLVSEGFLPERLSEFVYLLQTLQDTHDSDAAWAGEDELRAKLKMNGECFGLTTAFLDELHFPAKVEA